MIEVRAATLADLPAIEAMCAQEPNAPQWSRAQYERLLALAAQENALLRVAHRTPSEVVAFYVAQRLVQDEDEWELDNIVVASSARRQQIGVELLRDLIAQIQGNQPSRIFLEVRAANQPARKLYEKLGFRQSGRRKNYYSNPVDDALLYVLDPALEPPQAECYESG